MRMADLSGYPYFEVHFDKDGKVSRGANLSIPSSVRDLFIISHGWRNNEEDACTLYRGLFNSFRTVSEAFNADPSQDRRAGRLLAFGGVRRKLSQRGSRATRCWQRRWP